MKFLNPLLQIYQILGGGVPAWTQGQGSNLSLKDNNSKRLWIKPSGYRLKDVLKEDDLVGIDVSRLPVSWAGLSQEDYARVIKDARVGDANLRPSMETGFHAVLPTPYVLHFHSLVSILMESQKAHAESWLQRNWQQGHFYFLDYVTPGLDLTIEIGKKADGSLFFLKQHGVVLAGADASILGHWMEIEKKWMNEHYRMAWPPPDSYDHLCEKFSQGPLKVLFPDMAVYLHQMTQVLENQGEQWKLKSMEFKDKQKDLVDLWLATQILLSFEKNLPEISMQEVQKISGLPTEQYRILGKG